MSRRILRRLAALAVALCALLLAVPPSAVAQEDVLGQLQTMGDLSVELHGAPVVVISNGQSTVEYKEISTSNFVGIGLEDTGWEGAPLAWDAARFSMQHAFETESLWYGNLSVSGEVAPDGQAITKLMVSVDLSYCSEQGCATVERHEQYEFAIGGQIPFAGTEDLSDWGETGWCYNYQLGGDDIAGVLQKAAYSFTWADGREQLDYPATSGAEPAELWVSFCNTTPAAESSPAATTGFWEFTSREIFDPTTPGVYVFGTDPDCTWNPVVSIGESTAEASEESELHCDGPGGLPTQGTALFSWSPPPHILTPGKIEPLSVAVTGITSTGNPEHTRWSALIELYQDLSSADEVFSDGFIADAYYYESDPNNGSLPQTGEAQWRVPPGNPGDTLSLSISLQGTGLDDNASIYYQYQYVEVEKTPEPGALPPGDAAPEENEVPEDNDWSPPEGNTSDEDWEAIAAGLGAVGNIPGPEGLTETLVGVGLPAAVISVLTALGYISGAEIHGGEDGPPQGSAPHVTMTDALGNQFDYDWNPELGGYINPQTGGMLDPALWNEYNQNVAANRAFSDRERERMEARDTAFDRHVDQYNTRIQRERREGLGQALRAIEERGYGLGEDGARASARAAELARQARAGEPVPLDRAMAIERFISNREAGRSVADTGDRHEVTEWDVYKEQALGGARGIITGRNADGSTNWAGIGVRTTISIVSGGSSEYIFIPASAAYTYSDSREQGLTHSQALGNAAGQAAIELVLGKAVQGVAAGGGRLLGTAGQLVDEMAPGLSGYLRAGATGLKQEFGVLGRGVSNTLSRTQQAIANRLGVGSQPALNAAERQMQWRVTKAIAESADDDLVRIFGNNGRQTLATLESKGGLTPQQAGHIRRAISNQVDDALDDGAANAMRRFQERTGIQPEEVLVGDSGSTARGGAWSPGHSDFDRTVVPRFANSDVARYAAENGINEQQAVEVLSQRYRAVYQSEVDRAINQRTGLTAQEVDINIFDRIRPGTGDGGGTYASGYTNARQSVWGRTRVHRPGQRPYTTSGDALVDENALGISRATGTLPADPTRMNAGEFRGVVRQQWAAAQTHNDATSLAKALDRASEPARRLGVNVDANLNRVAQQIRNNPQQQAAILRQNGLTEAEFVQRSRQTLDALVQLIPD